MMTKQNEMNVAKDGAQVPVQKPSAFSRLLKEGIMKIPCVRARKLKRLNKERAKAHQDLKSELEGVLRVAIEQKKKEAHSGGVYQDRYTEKILPYDDLLRVAGEMIDLPTKTAYFTINKPLDVYGEGVQYRHTLYSVKLDGTVEKIVSDTDRLGGGSWAVIDGRFKIVKDYLLDTWIDLLRGSEGLIVSVRDGEKFVSIKEAKSLKNGPFGELELENMAKGNQ